MEDSFRATWKMITLGQNCYELNGPMKMENWEVMGMSKELCKMEFEEIIARGSTRAKEPERTRYERLNIEQGHWK